MATFAPCCASISAIRKPMPFAAPVTNATFPSNLSTMGCLRCPQRVRWRSARISPTTPFRKAITMRTKTPPVMTVTQEPRLAR